MAEKRKTKLIFRSGSNLLKAAVLVLLVVSIITLAALGSELHAAKSRAEDMRQQAAQLEQENTDLEQKINDLGTVEGVINIAQEELGLVAPDTVILTPEPQQPEESGGSK